MVKRKVVCVFGKFDDKSDFVLEPSCPEYCKCEYCKDSFWIEETPKASRTHRKCDDKYFNKLNDDKEIKCVVK